ncbi:PREDICTED: RING-H2 finger protein ATL5-like [Erythranthe guttata]|nr:PREDICTED: RING-H2 finger protein ATL5-like [Erythranthe guttata]|eukprot:XP_012840152.1 PREDICTED: RING-H2 finger protein ATL5-like [Erythranthe guttata]
MTKDEVNKLVHEAFEFARKIADDPRHASRLVIPVLVSLEVRTVQQEGEPVDSVIDRTIRAEKLAPLYLWPLATPPVDHPKFPCFLTKLPRNRVEDIEEGLKIMRACGICLRAPTIGAQITVLPSCGHAFHSHCIVRWLMGNNLCPLCNSPAYDGEMLDSPY